MLSILTGALSARAGLARVSRAAIFAEEGTALWSSSFSPIRRKKIRASIAMSETDGQRKFFQLEDTLIDAALGSVTLSVF